MQCTELKNVTSTEIKTVKSVRTNKKVNNRNPKHKKQVNHTIKIIQCWDLKTGTFIKMVLITIANKNKLILTLKIIKTKLYLIAATTETVYCKHEINYLIREIRFN